MMVTRQERERLLGEIREWFNPDDYSYVTEFTLEDWYQALSFRKRNADYIDGDLSGLFPDQFLWESFNSKRVPTKENLYRLVPDPSEGIPREASLAFEELRPPDVGTKAKYYSKDGWVILAVDPSAPDTRIDRLIEQWKLKFREEHPLPIKRQGPSNFNLEITKIHLDRWCNHHILEVFDIKFWAKTIGKIVPPIVIYSAISHGQKSSEGDWRSHSNDSLDEAIQAIHLTSYYDENNN